MSNQELKPCPFCGAEVNIHTHPEWDPKKGTVYGALIHHRNCRGGMVVGIYTVHACATRTEAHNALAAVWNRREKG